jgi:phosphinothricin acetyltransferase
MECRLVRVSDANEILRIYTPFVQNSAISFEEEPPERDEMADRIRDLSCSYPWFVATDSPTSTELLGYAYASPHRSRSCYRWSVEVSVYIDPSQQNRGVGRMLYIKLIDALQKAGFYNAYAGITLPNIASVAIHLSFGFTPIGIYEKVGCKFGRWYDVGWWGLTLNPIKDSPTEPLPTANLG